MDILVGSWDDYWSLMNNYYLYHDPAEDKFHWIPYDYDNTFGVDWFDVDWSNSNPYNFPMVVPVHARLQQDCWLTLSTKISILIFLSFTGQIFFI